MSASGPNESGDSNSTLFDRLEEVLGALNVLSICAPSLLPITSAFNACNGLRHLMTDSQDRQRKDLYCLATGGLLASIVPTTTVEPYGDLNWMESGLACVGDPIVRTITDKFIGQSKPHLPVEDDIPITVEFANGETSTLRISKGDALVITDQSVLRKRRPGKD